MRKIVIQEGQKFGKLTLIREVESFGVKSGEKIIKKRACLFLCECGKEHIARFSFVRGGYTKSCGCARIKDASLHASLVGKKFGKLNVMEFVPITSRENTKSRASFLCLCDCGAERIVEGRNLLSGNSKSCGCCRSDNRNLINKYFFRLKVVSVARKMFYINRNGKIQTKKRYNCECSCGNACVVREDRLVTGKTKSCGCFSIQKSTERLKNYRENKAINA